MQEKKLGMAEVLENVKILSGMNVQMITSIIVKLSIAPERYLR